MVKTAEKTTALFGQEMPHFGLIERLAAEHPRDYAVLRISYDFLGVTNKGFLSVEAGVDTEFGRLQLQTWQSSELLCTIDHDLMAEHVHRRFMEVQDRMLKRERAKEKTRRQARQ